MATRLPRHPEPFHSCSYQKSWHLNLGYCRPEVFSNVAQEPRGLQRRLAGEMCRCFPRVFPPQLQTLPDRLRVIVFRGTKNTVFEVQQKVTFSRRCHLLKHVFSSASRVKQQAQHGGELQLVNYPHNYLSM